MMVGQGMVVGKPNHGYAQESFKVYKNTECKLLLHPWRGAYLEDPGYND